jgi:1L-myo-inositol 1-phosphate cytidylyltransferase
MPRTNVAVILAAGNGSRLKNVSGSLPKPLVPVDGRPLLEHVILGAQVAGIQKFVIVLGYGGEEIRSWVKSRRLPGAQIELVQNSDYMKANGVSVLKARAYVDQPFLLLMGDHLFEPETATALLRQPIEADEVILAVDHKLYSIFDIDDATKVLCRRGHIIDIGKTAAHYNALDTGMFLCTTGVFTALERSMVDGNCSLSDGMRELIARKKLRAFDIGDAIWQDVDTPEAHEYATRLFLDRYRTMHAEEGAVRV